MKQADPKPKIGVGLSGLSSSTLHEDPPVPKSSPEKRSLLSPSVSSISEIFAKSASAKLASSKKEDKPVSPFATAKNVGASGDAPESRKGGQEETDSAAKTSPGKIFGRF